MRALYSLIYILLLPFILLRMLYRGLRHNVGYRQRWGERFGYYPGENLQADILIHAVSLGETIAAITLIKALLADPKSRMMRILLTTTTITGSQKAQGFKHDQVSHVYLPYDIPVCVKRFLSAIKPKVIVMMETELWPNLFYVANKKNIPVLIVNARLSEKSARGYAKVRFFMKSVLSHVTFVAAQSLADAERFIQLGLANNKTRVTGNLKFDLNIDREAMMDTCEKLNTRMSQYQHIWIAASTHPGEEEFVLAAHRKILKICPNTLLILVPRHPERAGHVEVLCQSNKFTVMVHSSNSGNTRCNTSDHTSAFTPDPISDNDSAKKGDDKTNPHQKVSDVMNTDIYLVDTVGELLPFFSISDCAFVGGSLVPIGGHNILEPIALDTPTVTGPYTCNFTEIVNTALGQGAVIMINNEDELAKQVCAVMNDNALRTDLVEAGQKLLENNKGATVRDVECIFQSIGILS